MLDVERIFRISASHTYTSLVAWYSILVTEAILLPTMWLRTSTSQCFRFNIFRWIIKLMNAIGLLLGLTLRIIWWNERLGVREGWRLNNMPVLVGIKGKGKIRQIDYGWKILNRLILRVIGLIEKWRLFRWEYLGIWLHEVRFVRNII